MAGAPGRERADAVAAGLLPLVEGLALSVLGRHLDPRQALEALDAHLDLVLGPHAPRG